MMETLTIIAYQQPVTRADVEAIRGVQSAEMIRQLLDKGLIRIAGEDDSLGDLSLTARQNCS
jgi:segregation and condensation protein B